MSDMQHDASLPSWFMRPVEGRNTQADLFPEPLREALASLRVSLDEARRWSQRGWIPFDLVGDLELEDVSHLRFVRDLVRSGLEDAQVARLMALLPGGILADADRLTYSFTHGWVIPVEVEEPEPDLESLIDEIHVEEDWDRLRELRDQIDCCLEDEPEEEFAE
jgi:hypothetical protein